MKISILHPFTPKVAGVIEKNVPNYHSQPHVKAMESLSKTANYQCMMEYFTPKLFDYTINNELITWKFYPVSRNFTGDHRKWRTQFSKSCLNRYKAETPDVTIINMSAQSSLFSYELSKVVRSKNKPYIAMLGGQNYSDAPWSKEYYKNAHHVLVHTHSQKNEMERMGMFKDRDIRVFPLGVDCNIFNPLEVNSENVNDKINLLYVGRITEFKRIQLAIEAFNLLTIRGSRSSELKIIGPISSETYLKELKELVKSYNLENNVHFLGLVEHQELPKYFKEADLFLLPSDRETFGMVMIESMACGTPVAAIDCPGGPVDVITNGVDGLLSTPELYAEDIVNLLLDKQKLSNMKLQARKKATEEYNIDITCSALKNSVESALN